MPEIDQSMNPLMPQGGEPPMTEAPAGPVAAPPSGPQAPGIFAQYDKLVAAGKMLDTVQSGLMKLFELGDTVSGEDVVREAGALVAQGLDATQMAGMLAEMPEKGDLLAQWVEGHLADLAQREAQLQFVTRAVRQQIGVETMRGLMVQHAENGG